MANTQMTDLSYNPKVRDTTEHSGRSIVEKQNSGDRQMHGISLVHDTMVGVQKVHKPVHLEGLIVETTGKPSGLPTVPVIEQTSRGAKDSKSVEKSGSVRGKTQPKTMGQVPYAGKKY